jgi:D-alanine-D-alanine ligase
MYPKLWLASGLAYDELLARIVTLARERHGARAALSTDYGA